MGTTARGTGEGSRRQWLVDGAIAAGFGLVAFLLRQRVPPDGFFFDDAWQAFAAVEGSFSELLTVGQTQPGFGAELLLWRQVFGAGEVRLIGPALLAGTLGPPALYLVLRRFHFARSIAVLLAAALTASTTHVVYSARVKAYTTEVLLVLVLTLVVTRLARTRWRATTALSWFVGSVLIASYSSFTLLASSAAGLVLVLHAKEDRRVRLVAVGAQAVATLGLLSATQRTHNSSLLTGYFEGNDGYIPFDANPLSFAREIGRHFARVAEVFPGGPAWLPTVAILLAMVGLAVMARRSGSRAVAARFMLVTVLLALGGAIAGRVPLGPTMTAYRASLWLVPIVAFGLAAVLDGLRGAAAERGPRPRRAFDLAVIVLAGLILLTPIGVHRPYPNGARLATREVMDRLEPGQAVLITRPTIYSFALYAGTPVDIRPTPERIQGLQPAFADDRIHAIDFLDTPQRDVLYRALQRADVVYVVDAGNDPAGLADYRLNLAATIRINGFRSTEYVTVGRATITTWVRTDEPR